MKESFPIGGPRQDVYDFFARHGFVTGGWGDKHWLRADGLHAHLYGSGSKCRIYRDDELIIDATLREALEAVDFQRKP